MKILIASIFSVFLCSSLSLAQSTLVLAVAKEAGVSEAEATKQVQVVFKALGEELAGGRDVTVRNFGKFYVSHREARVGRNPQTGASIDIPAKRYPKFRSSEKLKSALNQKL